MTDEYHEDLRRAFSALDRTMQGSAPSFAELTNAAALNTARRRHRGRRASLLIAAVAVPVFFVVRARSAQGFDFERFSALTGLDPGAVSWQAPSDFLLAVPGSDLLRTIPTIDVTVPAIPADTVRPRENRSSSRRSTDL
jgi:hypothetical protein